MPSETIFKTVYQYNKVPILPENMARLQEIAEDCRKVRNYVYDRYGGTGGLTKIYPGYTVQNEMTACGLREQLGLPSVYFYLSIFDALGDIKSQWSKEPDREKYSSKRGSDTGREALSAVCNEAEPLFRSHCNRYGDDFVGRLGGNLAFTL